MNKFFCSDNYNYSSHKKVSVMAVVRSNLDAISDMIANVFQTCINPDNVEMLIRMDDDDSDAVLLSQTEIFNKYNVKLYTGFRHGFIGIHKYFNELAVMTVGDLLFQWGDDLVILTSGWDAILYKHIGEIVVLQNMIYYDTVDGRSEASNHLYSPIIPRPLFDILAVFSPVPLTDSYYMLIGEMVGAMCSSGIDVLMLNQNDVHNKDAIAAWEEYNSEENKNKIYEDVIRVSRYFDNRSIPRKKLPCFIVGFHPVPKIEMRGGPPPSKYFIEFIDTRNNSVVFSISLFTYRWAVCNIEDFVPWLIKVTDENGQIVFEHYLDLAGKKVIVEMGGDNTENMLEWIPFMEQFRDKHNCKIVCLTSFPELFRDIYDGIQFADADTYRRENTDIYAFYKIEQGMDSNQVIRRLGLNG